MEYLKMKLAVKEVIGIVENFLKIYEEYLINVEVELELSKLGIEKRKILGMQLSLRTLHSYDNMLSQNKEVPILELENMRKDFIGWLLHLEEMCEENIMEIPLSFKNILFKDSYTTIYAK